MTLKEFHSRVNYVLAEEKMAVDRFFEAAQAHQMAAVNGSLVIYIEDDPDQVSLFKTMMACYSTLTVIPAMNDEDGQRLIRKRARRIKCVVMDVSLDKDDNIGINKGMELLSWIKKEYPELSVVVLTLHSELIGKINSLYPDVEVHVKAKVNMEKVAASIMAEHGVAGAV